jgi:hypothetical protein
MILPTFAAFRPALKNFATHARNFFDVLTFLICSHKADTNNTSHSTAAAVGAVLRVISFRRVCSRAGYGHVARQRGGCVEQRRCDFFFLCRGLLHEARLFCHWHLHVRSWLLGGGEEKPPQQPATLPAWRRAA